MGLVKRMKILRYFFFLFLFNGSLAHDFISPNESLKKVFSIEIESGENLSLVILKLFSLIGLPCICETSIVINEKLVFKDITYLQFLNFLKKRYNLQFQMCDNKYIYIYSPSIKNNNNISAGNLENNILNQRNNEKISEKNKQKKEKKWKVYNFNYPDYKYDSSNDIKNNGQDKESNNLKLKIESNSNIWNELEDYIKKMSYKYIINRRTGLMSVLATEKKHKIIEEFIKNFKNETYKMIEIKISVWEISSDIANYNSPVNISSLIMKYILYQNQKEKDKFFEKKLNLLKKNSGVNLKLKNESTVITINNQPVFFSNIQEEETSHNTITQVQKIRGMFHEGREYRIYQFGTNMYVHPTVYGNKVLIFFIPNEITQNGKANNIRKWKKKSMSSFFMLSENEEKILGGFTQTNFLTKRISIPVISYIPILDRFFSFNKKVRTSSRIIFSIRAKILN